MIQLEISKHFFYYLENYYCQIISFLGIHYLTGDNFLQELDNGAVLCHLAQFIKAKAKMAIAGGLTKRVSFPLFLYK